MKLKDFFAFKDWLRVGEQSSGIWLSYRQKVGLLSIVKLSNKKGVD